LSGEPALHAVETVRSVAAFFLVPDAVLADPRCDRPGDRRRKVGPLIPTGQSGFDNSFEDGATPPRKREKP
jgi:hypothetical protein